MLPQVEVDPPSVDEDSAYDSFANFVLAHPRPVVIGLFIILLMILWKKPLFRGIVIGALILAVLLSVATA